jgi:crotonobetainyl-CoA:carnitine CoA-transferase CaiB-like acyl-CoA transferase
MTPPLAGLRVLELGTGIAAPYAGRLLAMLGATVVKIEPESSDPARFHPVDGTPLAGVSPLYLALNAGKRNVRPEALPLEQALAWADAVIDSRVRRQLRGTALDPEALAGAHPHLTLASVTAWGFDAVDPGSIDDELLLQAVAGVTTLTGDPDAAPLRLAGWQSQYLAGAYTAAALIAAAAAPTDARPQHIEVAWVACAATGVEGSFTNFLFRGIDPLPAGAHPVQAFPGGAFRCADGHVVTGTVRQHDWDLQTVLYEMPELQDDPRFVTREGRGEHRDALWDQIQPWYDAHARAEIFSRAIELNLAIGMVMTAGDALSDPHLAERGFLATHDGPDGAFVAPARPLIAANVGPGATRVHDRGEDDAWFRSLAVGATHASPLSPASLALGTPQLHLSPTSPTAGMHRPRARHASPLPLEGMRVVELTTAWAGPFIGRFLGALGADVAKVESASNYDMWRGPALAAPEDGDDQPYNRVPNFNGLNRNKRDVALNLATPAGRELFLRLVAGAEVVITNLTVRALTNLRLTYADLAPVRPDLVMVFMPALGATGPYAGAVGYGTIIEGMGGFAARFGYPHEEARVSITYFPDAVAGIHGTVAALAGIAHQRRTGEGLSLDVSQQEALWLQLAEGIVHRSRSGREPERMGNAEPGCAPSGLYPTSDGRWLALVVRTDEEFSWLTSATTPELEPFVGLNAPARVRRREALDATLARWTGRQTLADALRLLEAAGVRAKAVNAYRQATHAPELEQVDGFEELDSAAVGHRRYLRVPLGLDGIPVRTRRPAPRFGEHTDEVLAEWLGLCPAEIESLRMDGVIADAPAGAVASRIAR